MAGEELMSESKNIFQRINAVMNDVKYVKKDAKVETYKAVTHDQVISVARESLVKHGIVIYPEQISASMPIMRDVAAGVKMHLYSGEYNINFVNIDKPEDRIAVKINAHANDNGDKAPGKAVTYATKAAILKVLCLETGENDESRSEASKTITEEQEANLEALISEVGANKAKFLQYLKLDNLDQMLSSSYDSAVKSLEAKRK